MGRLDELDLTLSLTREAEAERLEAAQTRLLALRLRLGGLVAEAEAGLERFGTRARDSF